MAFIQWPPTIGGMSCYSCLLPPLPPQPPRIFLPLSQWPYNSFCLGWGREGRDLPSSRMFSPSFHLTLFWTPRFVFISALFPFGSLLWSFKLLQDVPSESLCHPWQVTFFSTMAPPFMINFLSVLKLCECPKQCEPLGKAAHHVEGWSILFTKIFKAAGTGTRNTQDYNNMISLRIPSVISQHKHITP